MIVGIAGVVLFLLGMSIRIVKQFEKGVQFRMMAHPLSLQLRNLQSLVEIAVDHNSTVVFPAPLMSTIGELGSFLTREAAASTPPAPQVAEPNGKAAVSVVA